MDFSTKVIEKMAGIVAQEMRSQLPNPKDIRDVETGMRELLQKVGAEGLKRYDEAWLQAGLHQPGKQAQTLICTRRCQL